MSESESEPLTLGMPYTVYEFDLDGNLLSKRIDYAGPPWVLVATDDGKCEWRRQWPFFHQC